MFKQFKLLKFWKQRELKTGEVTISSSEVYIYYFYKQKNRTDGINIILFQLDFDNGEVYINNMYK